MQIRVEGSSKDFSNCVMTYFSNLYVLVHIFLDQKKKKLEESRRSEKLKIEPRNEGLTRGKEPNKRSGAELFPEKHGPGPLPNFLKTKAPPYPTRFLESYHIYLHVYVTNGFLAMNTKPATTYLKISTCTSRSLPSHTNLWFASDNGIYKP